MKSLKSSVNKALAAFCFTTGCAVVAQPVLASRCVANTPATITTLSGCEETNEACMEDSYRSGNSCDGTITPRYSCTDYPCPGPNTASVPVYTRVGNCQVVNEATGAIACVIPAGTVATQTTRTCAPACNETARY